MKDCDYAAAQKEAAADRSKVGRFTDGMCHKFSSWLQPCCYDVIASQTALVVMVLVLVG